MQRAKKNISHYRSWPEGLPLEIKPLTRSVYQNLENSVSKFASKNSIIYYGKTISYKNLFKHITLIGGGLNAFGNISIGDRVVVYMQNCPQFIISYYAILGINCVVVPVNPMLKLAEIAFIIKDSGAKVIICSEELFDNIPSEILDREEIVILVSRYKDYLPKKSPFRLPSSLTSSNNRIFKRNKTFRWDFALRQNYPMPIHKKNTTSICTIPYTSGSTGKPRGCSHSSKSINAVVHAYAQWLPLPKHSNILTSLPLFHVTGMQNSMNVPLFRGDCIVLMTRWDVKTALYMIKKYRIASWRSITTAIIDLIAEYDPKKNDLSSLKSLGGGGATMPIATARKLKKITSLNYIEAYGLTETMAPTHINPPDAPRLGSIGIPIFDVDARIINIENGKQLGANKKGELVIDAPQLFSGYWNDIKNSEEAFIELGEKRFFKTGDLGYYDNDGYFYIIDRLKRMINFSGFKVWPAEIENILYERSEIKEVCVTGVYDERAGQKVKAIIVLHSNIDIKKIDDLSSWCSERMAKYKVPTIFEVRTHLPKNKVGKIMWREL